MGASSITPVIGLPQFADDDKPTWRGDINAAFQLIDEAFAEKADKDTLDYYVADYGGIGDSVTDDTAHIQAAINDAAANGGGIVHTMRGKTHLVNGEVFVKTNVLLMGDIAIFDVTDVNAKPTLKYGTASSRLRVGAFAGRFGSVNGERPVGIKNIAINCNGHGPIANNDGAVYMQGGVTYDTVFVYNAPGIGMYLDAPQNFVISNSTIAKCAVGMCLDNGVGGLMVTRCEIVDNQIGIQNIDNQTMGNAYPFGSAHVMFEHCIVENYSAFNMLVDIQAGTLEFKNCGFSNNTAVALPAPKGLINISNPIYTGISTNAIFDGCLFVSSGEHMIRVVGNNNFYMYGQNYLQGTGSTTVAFCQDGGIGAGSIDGTLSMFGIEKLAEVINGGVFFDWYTTRFSQTKYKVDTDINPLAMLFQKTTDAGIRLAIGGDGSINFYNGADFVQRAAIDLLDTLKTLYLNTTGHVFQGPVEFDRDVQVDGSLVVNHHTITAGKVEPAAVVIANGTIPVDCDLQSHIFIGLVGSGHIDGLTIINKQEGSRLRVTYFIQTTATYNVIWPTGATPAAGKTLPATLNTQGVYSIDFTDIAGGWFEMGRNF